LKRWIAAIVHAQAITPTAFAVFHDQVEREIFDEEVRIIFQALLIQRVQHGVAGAVGGGAGALHRRAFAHILHVAAKGALVDGAIGVARKRHARMLQFVNRGRCLAHHIFDRVLIAQPVRPLDGVVHVPGPVIGLLFCSEAAIPPCAATVCERVGNTLVMQAVFRPASARPSSRAGPSRRADNNDIIGMIDDLVGGFRHQAGTPVKACLATMKMPNAAAPIT
jgi:hypothetical protein